MEFIFTKGASLMVVCTVRTSLYYKYIMATQSCRGPNLVRDPGRLGDERNNGPLGGRIVVENHSLTSVKIL